MPCSLPEWPPFTPALYEFRRRADKGRRPAYEAASPIKYIGNVTAPLLVLQGENDPRVPKEEADQVVDLLKRAGKVVDVHYYPNEGHGFEKRENQIDSIRRTLEWFDKHLKGQKAKS